MGTPVAVSAQTNFRPGYVVTLGGDTLRGEVDSRGGQRNARLARFRAAAEAPSTDYQPRQLRGYGFVGDRVYQTDSVALAVPAGPAAPYGAAPDTVRQPVFLEAIVRGPLSLLYLRDEGSNDHYYLSAAGQSVQELPPPPVRRIADDEATYRNAANAFRRTLAAATQQCPAMQPAVAAALYNQRSLSELVVKYNQCVGTTSVLPTAAYKSHVRLGLIGGVETSRLVLNGQKSTYDFVTKGGSNNVGPVVGLALTVGLSGVNRTISARLEGFYESQSYLLQSQVGKSDLYDEFRVKLTSIRVPLLVRYTYPRGPIRPFAQAGFSFSHLLDTDNEKRQIRIPANPNVFTNSVWEPIVKPRTLEQGLVGSLGLATAWDNRRNASVELRYERSNGFSNAVGFGSRVDRFYLLLGYDLTK